MGKTLIAVALLLNLIGSARGDERPVVQRASSDEQARAARVARSFLRFAAVRTVEERANTLELLRQRDRLLLFGGQRSDAAASLGGVLLGLTSAFAAHAPAALRPMFDGPVHVGPALFDGGGMGAGIGGRWL